MPLAERTNQGLKYILDTAAILFYSNLSDALLVA
jgi:hypothetical protein